jgi:hypothetical protein
VVGVSTYGCGCLVWFVRWWIYTYVCVCVYVKKSSLLLLLCVYVCKPTSPTLPSFQTLTYEYIYLFKPFKLLVTFGFCVRRKFFVRNGFPKK